MLLDTPEVHKFTQLKTSETENEAEGPAQEEKNDTPFSTYNFL